GKGPRKAQSTIRSPGARLGTWIGSIASIKAPRLRSRIFAVRAAGVPRPAGFADSSHGLGREGGPGVWGREPSGGRRCRYDDRRNVRESAGRSLSQGGASPGKEESPGSTGHGGG